MTMDYLRIAVATLFLFGASSWGQDNQEKSEEATTVNKTLTSTEGTTPPIELQDQSAEQKTTEIVQARPIKKQTQDDDKGGSAKALNYTLITILLVFVLVLLGCSLLLLKKSKNLRKDNKDLVERLRRNQMEASGEKSGQAATSGGDDQLKADLNDKLEQIAKYMQIVSGSSAEAAACTKETSAFAKQISETVVAKEQELSMLREGYQQSMIGPVINGFLNLRDKLTTLLATDLEAELKKQLENLNQSIEISLSEIGVSELPLEIGSDPLPVESKKWRALEATRPTSERQLDGTVAAIIKPGYTSIGPQGDEIVVRKAEVVRYKHDG